MKLNFLKRLIKEDFKQDQQDMIGKIGFILNPALESISSALENGLTIEDNFSGNVKEITVVVDSNGVPTTATSFKSNLKLPIRNVIVTRALNLTNSAVYPSGCPFVSFTDNSGQVLINHVTGLQANNKYQIRLLYTT